MTLSFPSGAVDEWPDDDSGSVVLSEANAQILLAVAGAYHSAQYMLAIRTEQLTRDLWRRLRPVNDASLGQWMGAWDGLLRTASAQQSRLTESYVRTSLSLYGVRHPALVALEPASAEVLDKVEDWLESDYADRDEDLRDEAEALIERLKRNSASHMDLARADRLPWLHTPVIEGRVALSEGRLLEDVEPSFGPKVDAAMRTNEFDVVNNVQWPHFKNGKAMLSKRVPSAGACGWCRIVATRLYSLRSMKRKAWHTGCRCDFVLATEAEVNAYSQGLAAGGYYEAARRIGTWTGPTNVNYNDVISQRAQVPSAQEVVPNG